VEIKVAFYRGKGNWKNKIIRWWTKSPYSHAELILPDGITWVSISPFLTSTVSARSAYQVKNLDDWDFLTFDLSWREPVRNYQVEQLHNFIGETNGAKYDWVGMILSQMFPYLIKHRDKWYCSEWIAHALVKARVVKWEKLQIYRTPNLSPGKLYELLKNYKPSYK
jgi:hypothetical protein